jgi:hypothetical protein
MSFRIILFMENPLIAGFVEIQHEPKTWAWLGKTTEGQAAIKHVEIKAFPASIIHKQR